MGHPGLAVVTGLTILADDATWERVVAAMLLAVVTAWSWVLVATWLSPAPGARAAPDVCRTWS